MTRCSFILVAFAGLSLAGVLRAVPAPAPKPPEARLVVKPLLGLNDKEQAASRKALLSELWCAVESWVFDQRTQLPGLADVPGRDRHQWMSQNLKMSYVGNTGVLRITCLTGTSEEATAIVNGAAKRCLSWRKDRKIWYQSEIRDAENKAALFSPDCNDPVLTSLRKDSLQIQNRFEQALAALPEINVLTLAPVYAKK